MGLLDQVVGGLMGGGSGSPMQNALMGLLSGRSNAGGSDTANQSGIAGALAAGIGGLPGLIAAFQQAGLGHVVQSWIGGGGNLPVSPEQLNGVLGQDRVQQMAGQAGMEPQDFLSQLSQHLPRAVDGVTPNGQMPDEGTIAV